MSVMRKFKVPNTYVIIFCALIVCAVSTWFVPGGNPQTWQVFSALYEGFSQQAGIIAFVLVIGGAFWVVNSTKAVDEGIMKFIAKVRDLERFALIRRLGSGNIVIALIMLLFGLFGAVFGMSEETIAFVAVAIPLAKKLGYDEFVGVCMVYVAAHVGFAGAMLNPFTIGIAQDMSGLPLFSGIEYRVFCWVVLNIVLITFVLLYAKKVKKNPMSSMMYEDDAYWRTHVVEGQQEYEAVKTKQSWYVYAALLVAMTIFSFCYPTTTLTVGNSSFTAPLVPILTAIFAIVGPLSLRKTVHNFILLILLYTIIYLIVGVMGYGWYVMEIATLFLVMGIASGLAIGKTANDIAKLFIEGMSDILSAAVVVGLAGGIVIILQEGGIIDTILYGLSKSMTDLGKIASVEIMYAIQTIVNVVIPSGSAKAAITMPIMAPFSDLIGVCRQATVMAFQFGDGFTNMITPTSGVLIAALGVARIPYQKWFKWVWKFILLLIIIGGILLIPTVTMNLEGF